MPPTPTLETTYGQIERFLSHPHTNAAGNRLHLWVGYLSDLPISPFQGGSALLTAQSHQPSLTLHPKRYLFLLLHYSRNRSQIGPEVELSDT